MLTKLFHDETPDVFGVKPGEPDGLLGSVRVDYPMSPMRDRRSERVNVWVKGGKSTRLR